MANTAFYYIPAVGVYWHTNRLLALLLLTRMAIQEISHFKRNFRNGVVVTSARLVITFAGCRYVPIRHRHRDGAKMIDEVVTVVI